MFQQAREAFKKNVETNREMNLQPLGHAYALAGKRAEALAILDELKEMSKQRYVSGLLHGGGVHWIER